MSHLSRRNFLQATAAASSALLLRPGRAAAQTAPKTALCIIFLRGGNHSIFNAADVFLGRTEANVTSSNIRDVGNGIFVDAGTIGSLSPGVLSKMACVGIKHGITSHNGASLATFNENQHNYALKLADAMGSSGAISVAGLGRPMPGSNLPEGTASTQVVRDSAAIMGALGLRIDPAYPNRVLTADALAQSGVMSSRVLARSPWSLRQLKQAYSTGEALSRQATPVLDYAEMAAAYGVAANNTNITDLSSSLLASELLIRANASVVVNTELATWDTHGDMDGTRQRNLMSQLVMPGLRVFLERTLAMTDRRVITVLLGEFARSYPGSGHATFSTVNVWANNVRPGTTIRHSFVDNNLTMATGTPGFAGFWAYLAALAGVSSQPFGMNPHTTLI